MHPFRAAFLAAVLLLPACASAQTGRLLEKVPRGQSAVVLDVRLEEPKRRWMVSEDALARVSRLSGVLNVERGSGWERLLVCLRGDLDGSYLAEAFRGEFTIEILAEVARTPASAEGR